ncbi:MAG TPA: hypothetical protein VMZ31_14285 [Phycisphaerae bacterium]|nr:hypothetical protein [Phycisphaerae bacterium]
MARWLTVLLTIAGVGVCLAGCGDEANVKGYLEPLRVVERTEFYLKGLRDDNLPRPDFSAGRDITVSQCRLLIQTSLPTSINTDVKDASIRQQAISKVEQLQTVFEEEVWRAALASPVERDKAIAGCGQCLAIVDEIGKLLGGK